MAVSLVDLLLLIAFCFQSSHGQSSSSFSSSQAPSSPVSSSPASVTYKTNGCSGTTTVADTTIPSEITACSAWTGDIHVGSVTFSEGAAPTPFVYDFGDLEYIEGTLAIEDIEVEGFDGHPEDHSILLHMDSPVGGGSTVHVDQSFTVRNVPALRFDFDEFDYTPEMLWFENSNIISGSVLPQLLDAADSITIINTVLDFKDGKDTYGISTSSASWLRARDNEKLNSISTAASGVQVSGNAADLSLTLTDATNASLDLSGVYELYASQLTQIAIGCWYDYRFTEYAYDMDSEACTDIPSQVVNGKIKTLSLPLVSEIQQLPISDNPDLSNLYMPVLGTVDSLEIYDNPSLKTIEFPALTEVQDEMTINGSMTSVDLPGLIGAGNLTLLSDKPLDCSDLNERQEDQQFVQGDYSCKGGVQNITETESPKKTDDGGISGGTIAGIVIGVLAAVLIVALVIFFLMRRKRKERIGMDVADESRGEYHKPELDSNPHFTQYEKRGPVEQPRTPVELPENYDPHELMAPHGKFEIHGRHELEARRDEG